MTTRPTCDSPGCNAPIAATVRAHHALYGFCVRHCDISRELRPVKMTKDGPMLDARGCVVFESDVFQPSAAPLRVVIGAAERERLRLETEKEAERLRRALEALDE